MRRVVLCCHGITGHKAEPPHLEDYRVFSEAGLTVIALDAPHHGDRKDAFQEEMRKVFDWRNQPEGSAHFWDAVERAAAEIPLLLDLLEVTEAGIYGFSMGGMIGYRALTLDKRLCAAVMLNTTPERWEGPSTPEFTRLETLSPAHFPDAFPPCALWAVGSGKDTAVDPEMARRFVERLRPLYAEFPERLAYYEYPHASHVPLGEERDDFRRRGAAWFHRFLNSTALSRSSDG